MSTAPALRLAPAPVAVPPAEGVADVDVAVPVYNEEVQLAASVRRRRAYLDERCPFAATVTIVDNASTDATLAIATRLAAELDGVRVVHLDRKGRGLALRAAWSASPSPVVAYMDVDLSTDLDALLPLVAPLLTGHSDVAIGTRLAPGSRVVRGPRRELISRAYNLVLRATLRNRFTDAQCGFKAVRADAARQLLPLVEDDSWFFDTELLVLAERNGFRIHEVPVDWVDDSDSRVDVLRTARDDLLGVARMAARIATGDWVLPGRTPPDRNPAALPAVGLGVQLGLFLALRGATGPLVANAFGLAAAAGLGRFTEIRSATAGMLAVRLAAGTVALAAVDAAGAGGVAAQLAALAAAAGAARLAGFLRTLVR